MYICPNDGQQKSYILEYGCFKYDTKYYTLDIGPSRTIKLASLSKTVSRRSKRATFFGLTEEVFIPVEHISMKVIAGKLEYLQCAGKSA